MSSIAERITAAQAVIDYAPLVGKIVNEFQRAPESREDLVQIGMMGLLRAVKKHDPHIGPLHPLAMAEIRGAILNYLRDHQTLIRQPRDRRWLLLSMSKRDAELALELGHWPSNEELERFGPYTDDEVRDYRAHPTKVFIRDIDSPVEGADGQMTIAETIGEVDIGYDSVAVRDEVERLLSVLPKEERHVVEQTYVRNKSQRVIGQALGVSQMQVSRLLCRALARMKGAAV